MAFKLFSKYQCLKGLKISDSQVFGKDTSQVHFVLGLSCKTLPQTMYFLSSCLPDSVSASSPCCWSEGLSREQAGPRGWNGSGRNCVPRLQITRRKLELGQPLVLGGYSTVAEMRFELEQASGWIRNKALSTKSQQRHGHNHDEAGDKPKSIMLTLIYGAVSKHGLMTWATQLCSIFPISTHRLKHV